MKRAIQNFKKELTSIYEILDVVDPSERLKPTNILVTGNFKPILLFRHHLLNVLMQKFFQFQQFCIIAGPGIYGKIGSGLGSRSVE